MEKIDLVLWMIGAGFAIMFSLILILWNHMNVRFDKLENRIDKLEERIKDLEHDMIEVKTILRMKECRMIQDERQMKKAE